MLGPHRLAALLSLILASAPIARGNDNDPPRHLRPDIDPIPLEIGPDTTVVEGPLRDDGTVDYIAALNAISSEGVTPENNAYVIIAELTHPDEWPQDQPGFRQRVFELLDVPMPADEAEYFRSFDSYARQRAEDEGGAWAERVEPEPEHGHFWSADRDRRWFVERERALAGPWTDEDAPLVARWLATQHAALDRLAAGVRLRQYYMPAVTEADEDMLFEVLVPSLAEMRDLARALRARAFHRLGAGNVDAAIEDIDALKRLGHMMKQDTMLIGHFVGISIAAMTRDIVGQVAGRKDMSSDQAARLAAVIDATAGRFPVDRPFDVAERLTHLDLLQRITDASERDVLAEHMGILAGLLGPAGTEVFPELEAAMEDHDVLVAYFDRNRAMRQANDYYDRLVRVMVIDDPARRAGMSERLEAELQRDRHRPVEGDDAERVAAVTDGTGKLLLQVLVESLPVAAGAADRAYAAETLESVAAAVAAHRAGQGEYPDTLDALVPDYLDAVPRDILDPDGQPIRYRLEDDRVVVYSVGRNGQDDGGVDDPTDGDITIEWPR